MSFSGSTTPSRRSSGEIPSNQEVKVKTWVVPTIDTEEGYTTISSRQVKNSEDFDSDSNHGVTVTTLDTSVEPSAAAKSSGNKATWVLVALLITGLAIGLGLMGMGFFGLFSSLVPSILGKVGALVAIGAGVYVAKTAIGGVVGVVASKIYKSKSKDDSKVMEERTAKMTEQHNQRGDTLVEETFA